MFALLFFLAIIAGGVAVFFLIHAVVTLAHLRISRKPRLTEDLMLGSAINPY